MLQNLTNFLSLISSRQVKTTAEADDLVVLGTRDTRFGGSYKPTAIRACDLIPPPVPPVDNAVEILGTGCNSTVRKDVNNTASGRYSAALAGCSNTVTGRNSTITGGSKNYLNADFSFIGTGNCNIICNSNSACTLGSVVVGGVGNNTTGGFFNSSTCVWGTDPTPVTTTGPYTFIGSGFQNVARGFASAVVGGCINSIGNCVSASTITGGQCNQISAGYSAISGGVSNSITYTYGFVGGGCTNTASGNTSAVVGGYLNTASSYCSFVGGGACNVSSFYTSTVVGGFRNTASGNTSFIGGGFNNLVAGHTTTIAGGNQNKICSGATCQAFIGGGNTNTISGGYRATIGGGYFNCINADDGFIGSGNTNFVCNNICAANARGAVVVGGVGNNTRGGTFSTNYGGFFCVQPTKCNAGIYSFVGGGFQNVATGDSTAVLGGRCNTASCACSFIVGSNITSDRVCTTFVNALSMKNAPTSSAGLPAGTIWVDTAAGNVLKMV